MAYTPHTFTKQALLAVSAVALFAVAAPAASAAPQDGRSAKPSPPHSHQTDRNLRRDNRQARNSETRRDNRQARNTETRRDNRQARNAVVRQENRQARRAAIRQDNRQARREEIRRDIRRDNRQVRRIEQRRDQRHVNRHYVPPRPVYTRPIRHNNQRVHSNPYRSNLGITFHFGSPGYSRHRWAPAAYSFYRPSYGHYAHYQQRTTCRRVTLEAWRYGHPQLVSVKQCSNPWDGTYIIQGSERLISRW